MRRAPIEFEARYYFPPAGGNPTGRWAWRRYRERLVLDLPSEGHFVHQLPPPMFTYNASIPWRFYISRVNGRGLCQLTDQNGSVAFSNVPFVETSLWSQVKFVHWDDNRSPGPWWLRWRCPDAPNDLLAKVYDYLGRQDDAEAQQIRRELTLQMLGGSLLNFTP